MSTQFVSVHAAFLAYLILFHRIIITKFGEDYDIRNSSSCSFLQNFISSHSLNPNILVSFLQFE
jgi:hypothetical protein